MEGTQGTVRHARLVAAGAVNTPQAHAQDSAPVNWWNVKVNLSSDGVAHVDATLEMDFSKVKGRGLCSRCRSGSELEMKTSGIASRYPASRSLPLAAPIPTHRSPRTMEP